MTRLKVRIMIKRPERTMLPENDNSGLEFSRFKGQKGNAEFTPNNEGWEKEWLAIKEKDWELDGVLIISGKPGAGTSSGAKILAGLYQAELYKAGDTIREMTNNKDRASGFMKRNPEIDHVVDEKVRRMVMDARRGHPAIAEAQIGGATALETVQAMKSTDKYPGAPILRFLFWATKDERVRRLKLASDEAIADEIENLTLIWDQGSEDEVRHALGDKIVERAIFIESLTDEERKHTTAQNLLERIQAHETGTEEEARLALKNFIDEIEFKTREQIWKDTTDRERDDLNYWRKLYPNLIGEHNPLEKNARDAKGNNIYSAPAFDNTDWGSADRTAYEVHKYLAELGFVRPKTQMLKGQSLFLGYTPEENFGYGVGDETN